MARFYKRRGRWYMDLRDARGIRRRLAGYTSRKATEEYARRVEALAEIRSSGALLPADLKRWLDGLSDGRRQTLARIGLLEEAALAATTALPELIERFATTLRARGRSDRHVTETPRMALRVARGVGATRARDITAERVERWLLAQREAGWSPTTSNRHLTALRQFTRWLVERELVGTDPLRSLKRLPEPRSSRDTMTEDEIALLLAATNAGPWRGRMSGPARALLYRLAIETGLRLNEMRSLTVDNLSLGEPAVIELDREASKRRRDDVVALRRDTAVLLAEHVAGRSPCARVFNIGRSFRAAEVIRRDLEAGGVATEGRDFHTLRHVFTSRLEALRLGAKLMQTLARHSTPTLTLGRYAHLSAGAEHAAVESLPSLDLPAREPMAAATGDGACSGATIRGAGRRSLESASLQRVGSPQASGALGGGHDVALSATEDQDMHTRGGGGIGRRIGLKSRCAGRRKSRRLRILPGGHRTVGASSGAIQLAEVIRLWAAVPDADRERVLLIVRGGGRA